MCATKDYDLIALTCNIDAIVDVSFPNTSILHRNRLEQVLGLNKDQCFKAYCLTNICNILPSGSQSSWEAAAISVSQDIKDRAKVTKKKLEYGNDWERLTKDTRDLKLKFAYPNNTRPVYLELTENTELPDLPRNNRYSLY